MSKYNPLAIVALAFFTIASPALAQNTSATKPTANAPKFKDVAANQRRAAQKNASQVSVFFSVRGPLDQTRLSDQDLAGMRTSLYQSAARECEALKSAFNGNCRLKNLAVADPNRRNATQFPFDMAATATYEITPAE